MIFSNTKRHQSIGKLELNTFTKESILYARFGEHTKILKLDAHAPDIIMAWVNSLGGINE